MRLISSSDTRRVSALLSRSTRRSPTVERRVAKIIADVREHGDEAVRRYARTLDGLHGPLELTLADLRKGSRGVTKEVGDAVKLAARHIRSVAKKQVPRGWRTRTAAGVTIEQRVTPLDRVGCYVPAGRYPLPSSLLMTAIPVWFGMRLSSLLSTPAPAAAPAGPPESLS